MNLLSQRMSSDSQPRIINIAANTAQSLFISVPPSFFGGDSHSTAEAGPARSRPMDTEQ
jgi:hypothetical protein